MNRHQASVYTAGYLSLTMLLLGSGAEQAAHAGQDENARTQSGIFVCPQTLDSTDPLPHEVASVWKVLVHKPDISKPRVPAQAERIEIYAGEPGKGGELIPDQSTQQFGVTPVTWNRSDLQRQQLLYMACTYSGTSVRLVRVLPKDLTSCTANNEFEDRHLQLECD